MNESEIRALPWEGLVPLRQVLELALPAYGEDSLIDTLKALQGEPSEVDIIEALAEELNGAPGMLFEEPVWLYFAEPAVIRVADGMHRIAAAELAGAEHLRVTLRRPAAALQPFDGQLVQVHYRLTGLVGEAADDVVFYWLRSFRLAPRVWVEGSTMSCSDGVNDITYYCPHRLRDHLVEQLKARAAARGAELQMIRVRATTQDELDREWDEQEAARLAARETKEEGAAR